ncbi:MAG: hypothetical protein IT548_03610 [Alphaproteobacteria bacterium]|nr:hypothetical protein [Alphaproteobacteria bacterium]
MKTLAAFAAGLALAGAASAADARGGYQAVGVGANSCAQYLAAPRDVGQVVGVWLSGYFTAMNQVLPDTTDVLAGRTDADLEQALVSACQKQPTQLLADAANQMLTAMAPARPAAAKTKKKSGKQPKDEAVPELRR